MDYCNHSPILPPQLGHVELSQRPAPRQCWHPSDGKARQIKCKYISSNFIGTHKNVNTHSSFLVCFSQHTQRISHCSQAVVSIRQSWKENLYIRCSASCTLFPGSSLHEELARVSPAESVGFSLISPLSLLFPHQMSYSEKSFYSFRSQPAD